MIPAKTDEMKWGELGVPADSPGHGNFSRLPVLAQRAREKWGTRTRMAADGRLGTRARTAVN